MGRISATELLALWENQHFKLNRNDWRAQFLKDPHVPRILQFEEELIVAILRKHIKLAAIVKALENDKRRSSLAAPKGRDRNPIHFTEYSPKPKRKILPRKSDQAPRKKKSPDRQLKPSQFANCPACGMVVSDINPSCRCS